MYVESWLNSSIASSIEIGQSDLSSGVFLEIGIFRNTKKLSNAMHAITRNVESRTLMAVNRQKNPNLPRWPFAGIKDQKDASPCLPYTRPDSFKKHIFRISTPLSNPLSNRSFPTIVSTLEPLRPEATASPGGGNGCTGWPLTSMETTGRAGYVNHFRAVTSAAT